MAPQKDSNCIFCKVVDKQIPSKLVKESNDYVVIRDINPQAPTHVLIVPKQHVRNIAEFEDADALGRLFQVARDIANNEGLENGFRVVVNTGTDGGQTVDHLHIHVLGGRALGWPPG
ncbi:MAG TPA: histidine triad nucleotide-binding protein [Candidatus Obscuribacterales bacterium]